MACGQALHHHRGRRAVIARVGDRHERRSRERDPLRIASGRIDPRDPPAGLDVLDAVPHRQDTAHTLDAKNLGIGNLGPGHALSYANVHEVDAREADLNQCFAWTRHRVGALDIFQHLAAARAVHYNSFHRLAPILNDRSVTGQKRGYRRALSAMSARLVRVARSAPPRPATRMPAMFAIRNSATASGWRPAATSPSRCASRTRAATAPRKLLASNALISLRSGREAPNS